MGALIRKMLRQPRCWVNQPPANGPQASPE